MILETLGSGGACRFERLRGEECPRNAWMQACLLCSFAHLLACKSRLFGSAPAGTIQAGREYLRPREWQKGFQRSWSA